MVLSEHLYGFFVALSLFVLSFYSQKRAPFYGLKAQSVESAYLASLIFALIGARLYHVFSSFSYYLHSPLKILFLWEGGLGIFGGIIGGIIGLGFCSKWKHIDFLKLLNLMAPPLLLVQAIGRVGNFFNHEGFGPPTNLPWKIFIPIEYRPPQFLAHAYFHPTFFYESLLCLLAFLVFVFFIKRRNLGFVYYLWSYGIIRFMTEFWRWDTWTWNGFKVAQALALGAGIAGLLGWRKSWQKTRK